MVEMLIDWQPFLYGIEVVTDTSKAMKCKLESYSIIIYRIAQNSGGEKLWWQISNFQRLPRKTLANARSCSIGWGQNIRIPRVANRSQSKSFADRSVIAKLFQ